MTGLPAFPTDNLYKFCAIAGLVIIGFFYYLQTTWSADFDRRAIAVSMLNNKIGIEIDHLKDLSKSDEREAAQLSNPREDVGKIIAETTGAEFKAQVARHAEILRDSRLKNEEARAASQELGLVRRELAQIERSGTVGGLIGACLAGFGFSRWFVQQRKQDQLLDRELAVDGPNHRAQGS